jgi:hypothetical protein
MAETAAQRFARDYGARPDNANNTTGRKARDLDNQSLERAQRLYVAPDGSTPADDENVHNP